jgi:plasmid replication initiation protein
MGYGNDKRLSDKLPVVKRNPLVEAKFKTTALEYKILMVAASKISSSDDVMKDISFTVDEFCSLLGVEADGMYDYMKRACERLVSKPVAVKNESMKEYVSDLPESNKGYTVFPWLHHIIYDDATVNIRFHEYMKPLLLYVLGNEEYTKYILENITKCDSIYSMRVYELLKQYQKIGERVLKLQELREMLGIKKTEYTRYNDFKRYVIQQAHKEINEKTDIRMDYEEIKQGRKVVAIRFYVKPRNKYARDDDNFKCLDALPKEQLVLLLQREIQNRYVVIMPLEIINRYSETVIVKLLKDLKNGYFDKANIHSPLGFFRWQLDETAAMYQD